MLVSMDVMKNSYKKYINSLLDVMVHVGFYGCYGTCWFLWYMLVSIENSTRIQKQS
jgi:hypothetical protein